jgi:hypothetical protein
VDDPKRFGRVGSVGVYFGLIPCQDASASKNRLGHITKEGPATVRKLLTEAAWQGTMRSPRIKAHFAQIAQGKPERRKIALVATARWLSTVMLSMLKSGECWRSEAPAAPAADPSVSPTGKKKVAIPGEKRPRTLRAVKTKTPGAQAGLPSPV